MTLKQVFDRLNEIALKQPEINEIIKSGNVYDVNTLRNIKYGVFCAVQDVHSADIVNSTNTYNFFLYYIDRLSSDKDNKIEIQSTAVESLKNILRTFYQAEDVEYSNVTFTPFTDSFDGLCAGAYATVGIIVPDDGCVENFE